MAGPAPDWHRARDRGVDMSEPGQYSVYVANAERTKLKLFKGKLSESDALDYCSALKKYGMDADVAYTGDDEPPYEMKP
jgi:hypothetical protein